MKNEPLTATDIRKREKDFYENPPLWYKIQLNIIKNAQEKFLAPIIDNVIKILNKHGLL